MKWSIFARKSNKCGDMEMLLYLFLRRFVRKDYTGIKNKHSKPMPHMDMETTKETLKKKSPEE